MTGSLMEDQTWCSNNYYLLQGGVYVGDWPDGGTEVTLTIQAGTKIYGDTTQTSFLSVQRDARCIAVGTPYEPILMTSGKEEGQRARGDWGGLIINGNAPLNSGAEASGEGETGMYGGNDGSDDSGVYQYIRVEFAGQQLTPDNELNGIAFQGVGSGTTIDHLHVHMGQDDGIEFFGGEAEWKYLITTGIGDDNLDWTDGWAGKGQFFVSQHFDDESDQGIEADNNGDDNSATPFSDPILSNLTLVGVADSEASDIGALLREGTKGDISNMILTDFNDACLDVDHQQTWDNVDDGSLSVTYSILDCATNYADNGEDDPDGVSVEDFFTDGTGNSAVDPDLGDNYLPNSGSPALGNGSSPSDSFFDAADYIGAVGPDNDWVTQGVSDGWINFSALN